MPTIKKVDAFIKAAKVSSSGNARMIENVNRVLTNSIKEDKKRGSYSIDIYLSREEKKCFG